MRDLSEVVFTYEHEVIYTFSEHRLNEEVVIVKSKLPQEYAKLFGKFLDLTNENNSLKETIEMLNDRLSKKAGKRK